MKTVKEKRKGSKEAELMLPEFPREKSEKELKIREEELALKAREVENEKEKQTQMFKNQEAMIANMA